MAPLRGIPPPVARPLADCATRIDSPPVGFTMAPCVFLSDKPSLRWLCLSPRSRAWAWPPSFPRLRPRPHSQQPLQPAVPTSTGTLKKASGASTAARVRVVVNTTRCVDLTEALQFGVTARLMASSLNVVTSIWSLTRGTQRGEPRVELSDRAPSIVERMRGKQGACYCVRGLTQWQSLHLGQAIQRVVTSH